MNKYYVVKFSGPFGFIKPWTAVRDAGGGETFSQQFLTPSIVEGLRQKLGISAICRHKLMYSAVSPQQEVVQAKAWKASKKVYTKESSILKRGVLVDPILYLAFANLSEAKYARTQHVCLCRNEDILLPSRQIVEMTGIEFDQLAGYELRFEKNSEAFMVGYNRFDENREMYGWIDVVGNPIYKPTYDDDYI